MPNWNYWRKSSLTKFKFNQIPRIYFSQQTCCFILMLVTLLKGRQNRVTTLDSVFVSDDWMALNLQYLFYRKKKEDVGGHFGVSWAREQGFLFSSLNAKF